MKEENIRKYAELMNELSLTGMEITEDGTTLRLERTPVAAPVKAADVMTVAVEEAPKPVVNGTAITSPMVGIFYSAPAENAEPYVKVGDKVSRGDTLCIIEAMKLMNEITAETDGVISEVLAKNGQVVDFGTKLFMIN